VHLLRHGALQFCNEVRFENWLAQLLAADCKRKRA